MHWTTRVFSSSCAAPCRAGPHEHQCARTFLARPAVGRVAPGWRVAGELAARATVAPGCAEVPRGLSRHRARCRQRTQGAAGQPDHGGAGNTLCIFACDRESRAAAYARLVATPVCRRGPGYRAGAETADRG